MQRQHPAIGPLGPRSAAKNCTFALIARGLEQPADPPHTTLELVDGPKVLIPEASSSSCSTTGPPARSRTLPAKYVGHRHRRPRRQKGFTDQIPSQTPAASWTSYAPLTSPSLIALRIGRRTSEAKHMSVDAQMLVADQQLVAW